MRLCTLLASYEQASSPFRDVDPYLVPHLWAPEHEWETHLVEKVSAVRTVRALARKGFDAFVNLCDGCWDEEQAGLDVVIELERLGVAFTGPDARFFEPTRQALKLVCADAGVDSPRYVFAACREEAELAAGLCFPLLVKPVNGYGSIGVTTQSRVTDMPSLFAQVERMVNEYGGALIEEFIEGREFTVFVAEPGEGEDSPRGYPPIEIVFPPGETFKHFDLKWREYDAMRAAPVEDPDLALRLQDAAARVFEGFDGTGYARFDLRLSADGRLHMLDINTTPGVFYPPGALGSADLILQRSPGGHRAFLDHIVGCAILRRDARRRRWALRHHPVHGHIAVAVTDIAQGERVYAGEGRPRRFVSREWAGRRWPAWRLDAVTAHASVLPGEVLGLDGDDPEGRFPARRAEGANVAVEGLDFVARRPIARGEELTIDAPP